MLFAKARTADEFSAMLASEKPARDSALANREDRAAFETYFRESRAAALQAAIRNTEATVRAAALGIPAESHAPDDGSEQSYRDALAAWKAHVERQEEERKRDAKRSGE